MIEIPGCAHIIHVSVQHSCTEHPTHCQDTGLDTGDRILSKANTALHPCGLQSAVWRGGLHVLFFLSTSEEMSKFSSSSSYPFPPTHAKTYYYTMAIIIITS